MIARYLALTFALTWTAWAMPRLLGPSATPSGLFAPGGPVFLLGVYAPGLIALGMIASSEGRAGVRRSFGEIGHWKVPSRWYLFALSYFILIKLSAAGITRLMTGAWPPFGDAPLLLIPGAILVSTLFQAGEELGWRGYLLPRLSARLGLGGAGIVVGLIWATWHLPLFYLAGSPSEGQSFPVYLMHVTALSVAMTWLYWRTGRSLLLVMVLHAAVNNTTGIVSAAVPGATNALSFRANPLAWITVVLSWVVALWMLGQMRGAQLTACVSPVPSTSGHEGA